MEDLIGVPHPLRFSKGAGFESTERREPQNPDPSENREGSVTRKTKTSLSAITCWSGIIPSSAFVTTRKAKGWATHG